MMMMMKRSLQAPARKILRVATRSRWHTACCSSSFRSSSHVVSRSLLCSHMSRSSTLRFVSQDVGTLRQLTKRVLAIEGPLSPKAWNGAETAFDMWTCHPVTQEGVEWGWKLLDRLVDEERQHSNGKSRLTTGWLYRMVGAYSNGDSTMDPEQVLAKLEGYAPILVVDEKTQSMLQAAAKETHSSHIAQQQHQQQQENAPVIEPSASTDRPTESCRNDNVFIRLHNAPIGSMNDSDWEDAENALLAQADSQAFRLLDRLVDEDHNSQQRITTEWLNRIVQIWCTNGLIDPTELLVRLNSYAPLPDISTYGLIVSSIRQMSILDRPVGSMTASEWAEAEVMLRSWTNETATRESVSSAWKLLDRLVEEEKYATEALSDYDSQLKSAWLDRIVAAWCRCGSSLLGMKESTQVLVKMNRYAPLLSPDPNTYQMIVAAVSKMRPSEESKLDEAVSVPETLREPKSEELETDHGRKPDPRSLEQLTTSFCNKMIHDLINSKRRTNPQKAEEMLEEMWKLYEAGNLSVKPDTITYSTVIKVWGRSSHPLKAEKAEGILERMIALRDAGDATMRPDVITFISVIAAWSSSRDPAAGERADALFRQMQEMYEAGNSDLKPNTSVFNALLTVWSESRDPRAAERAQAILRQMQELYGAGHADAKPDTISFNRTLKACAYSRDRRRAARAERVESLLELMQKQHAAGNVNVKPNTASFTTVLLAWSKCEDTGERAEAILRQMEALYEAGDSDVKPDTFCYNAVLIANVSSSDENAAERSQRILDQMEKLHAMGDPDVKPNTLSYNSVVIAWARSGKKSAPIRIEAILRRLQDLCHAGDLDIRRIIAITLLRVISVWVDSHDENAAEHAVRHLEELKKLGLAGAKKFEYAYEKVARLLSKSKHPDDDKKIDMLLQTMQRLGTGLEDYAPKGRKGPSEHIPERNSGGTERAPEDCDDKNSGLADDLDKEDKSRLSPSIASGYTREKKETLLVVVETS